MKILIRILLILVLLVVVGVFALNLFLEKGLNPAIQAAIPKAEEKMGVDLAVGNASISLFAGSMTLEEVAVGNPKGFNQPELFTLAKSVQDVALLPLITKQEIRIQEVTIEQSNLTVVRNTDGDINLQVLLAALQGDTPPTEEETPPAEEETEKTPEEPQPLPPFQLEELLLTSVLTYVQEKDAGDPFQLALNLKINAEDLGTIGGPDDRGTLDVQGNLAGNQDLFVIGLTGTIAPITDPLQPTFELKGKVDSVELSLFDVFQKQFKIDGGMMGLDMVLNAKDGVFDSETSVVRVLISQPEIGSGLGVPAGFNPATLAFPVKISGTVQEPQVNFMQGLKQGIRDAITNSSGMVKQVGETVDQTKKQAEETVAKAKDQAEQATEQAQQAAEESLKSIEEGKIPELDTGSLDSLTGDDEEGDKKSGIKSLFGGFGGSDKEE